MDNIVVMRRSGMTTRLADQYIQELFTTGYVEVRDHVDTRQMHEYLWKMVIRRLQFEHFKDDMFERFVSTRRNDFSITLKKESENG